jgi:hypothetical protein
MNSNGIGAILGVIAMLVILFFAVPVIAGGSTNICQDVESHNVSKTASNITGTSSGPMYNVINSVGQVGATGNVEKAKQSSDNPNTPSVVSCAGAWWQSL